MIPSGTPNPAGGGLSANPSLLRTSTGVLGQSASIPSQPQFSSLVSPRNQFANTSGNNFGLLGNTSNASSLLSPSFGNGGPGSIVGLPGSSMNLQQRSGMTGMDMVGSAEPDPLSFASSSGQFHGQQFANPTTNQLGLVDHARGQQVELVQNYQQQFSAPQNQQQFSAPQNQQQHLRGGLGHASTVKIESQLATSDQLGTQQQLTSLRNLSSPKLEPQQLQSIRNSGSVKLEPHQHSDPSLFLQQQQQQLLQLRQSSQAAQTNLLQQQRLLQLQQQQQQLLKTLPSQRPQLQHRQQHQQQLQQALLRPQGKPSVYEPGICARRLNQYMYHQQHRPSDNSIEYWRKFVKEYFAPHAKKRWCVSLYGTGRQTSGIFPRDVWHCEICNHKPGRGFETTVEVLPRLCKIKYDSGTLEELLYVDMPQEYQNASGQIVLDYAKAIQESVFENLRVVRDGQLRIVFNSELKICSWEFCARHHEELIPRRLIVPHVSQLGTLAQKCQVATPNASSNSGLSSQDLQSTCNSFVSSARQLAKALEVPLVNDLGYTKRYVRCLQIAEVVNSMKDLIDYSRQNGTGPMASLINFPRLSSSASGLRGQVEQRSEEQQSRIQNSNPNDQNSARTSSMQHGSANNGVMNVNSTVNTTSSTTSASNAVGLLHQNSMNSRQENQVSNMNAPYGGGNAVQIPSASSSTALSQPQANGPNPSSPFTSPTLSTSNNVPQATQTNTHLNTSSSPANVSMIQQPLSQSNETDMTDAQSSVQQIIQEMMMSPQLNAGSLGNEMKGINGITPALSGGNGWAGNGICSNSGMNMGYGNMGCLGPASTAGGFRAAMANNPSMTLNGRSGINQIGQDTSLNHQQQQNLGNRFLANGLGKMNGFNNLNFDWKTTP